MESTFEEFAGLAESPHGQAAKRLLFAGSPDGDAVGKKRRKQSRPIRIPSPSDPSLEVQLHVEQSTPPPSLAAPPPSMPPEQVTPPAPPYPYGLLPSLLQFSPHFLLPMLPTTPPTPSSQSASATTPGGASTSTPSRIFNLEAYCELCSKEFCNKYFLKTHKANRHGIYVKGGDTPPAANTPLPVDVKIPTTPESTVKFPCDACPKKFGSEYTLKRHKVKTHAMAAEPGERPVERFVERPLERFGERPVERFGERSVERFVERPIERFGERSAELFGERPAERPGSAPPTHQQPSEAAETPATEASPLSPGRLRRLGVINADAFCEICSKEYCNKYFLKTHKLKRHGIRDPEDPLPKGWPLLQTSPLNLTIASEQHLTNGNSSSEQQPAQEEEGLLASYLQPKDEPEEARDLSEDLQKLQTMLLQLNALNGAAAASDAVFAPQAEQNGQGVASSPPRAESAPLEGAERKEPEETSGLDITEPLVEVTIKQESMEELQTDQPQPEDLEGAGSSGLGASFSSTSCYCDICNKELCNKYFKKVHMQKMHGIEIKDNALSGGVPCDICHKQLCSKYFVRVHKQNTHGIVDLSAPPLPGSPQVSGLGGEGITPPLDASLKPMDGGDLNHRYFAHFNVVCPLCSRRFRSAKWLRAHLVNDHAEQGLELARELEPRPTAHAQTEPAEEPRNQYHCSYCSFSTPVLSLLFVHERSHAGLAEMRNRPSAHAHQHLSHQQQLQQVQQAQPQPPTPPSEPKPRSEQQESGSGVWRSLREAARESQVPATYAVPQAPPDKFIMQPFLLEEPPDGTFVPSLVFLPVREKVSGQLTVSFTLTPA
ncbi:zinc finger protein 219 [Neocloeon triangulifer]|uniref:zinc finger protein 219 n=1 Tax=Neocloeon triangulifer TaxID=2078957 RepID=UPI00286F198F|nr:zinc finger protein 219 [Neocloeon triangulifer]